LIRTHTSQPVNAHAVNISAPRADARGSEELLPCPGREGGIVPRRCFGTGRRPPQALQRTEIADDIERRHALIKPAFLRQIPDAGHLGFLERPEAVNSVALKFFTDV